MPACPGLVGSVDRLRLRQGRYQNTVWTPGCPRGAPSRGPSFPLSLCEGRDLHRLIHCSVSRSWHSAGHIGDAT